MRPARPFRSGLASAMRVSAVAALLAAAAPARAADLGVRGQTWPVAEPDLLEQIEARLSDMQRSGELARLEAEARVRARTRLEAPDPVAGVAPARERRSRLFDPALVVDRDIRSPDGTLIAAAGTRLDPLAGMTLALRALPDAGDEEVAVPLADDPAGPGHDAAHRLQPDGPLLGAVGDAPRDPRLGRELRLPAVEKTDMLPTLKPRGTAPTARILAGLACALLLAACCRPALADDVRASAKPGEAESRAARDLVEEILREAGDGGLGDWTRSIIDRALKRAGEAARQTVPGSSGPSSAPLPAERHAARTARGLAGRGGTAEILLFTSLSVPAASWRQWARDAARTGSPLVLRGVGEGGLRATVKAVGDRLGGHDAGVAIDPRLFRLFGVTRVPAVAVVPGGVPPCASRGCSDDPAPPHDRVTGNIGLAAALEAIAAEGGAGRAVARRHLELLRGEK